MVKKIVLGTLLVGLIGFLIVGGIIRTADKTGNVAEARGQGAGRAHGSTEGQAGVTGAQGQGTRAGQGGQRDGQGLGTATGQAEAGEWLDVQGVVVGLDTASMVVQTADGSETLIDGRAWTFALESGFSAKVGDRVNLAGFYEDGEFKVGQIGNDTTGETVQIRQQDGRPLWAGRGRGG